MEISTSAKVGKIATIAKMGKIATTKPSFLTNGRNLLYQIRIKIPKQYPYINPLVLQPSQPGQTYSIISDGQPDCFWNEMFD